MVTMTITKKLMVIVTGAKIGLQSSARMAGEKLYCPLGLTSNHCNLKMCWCWRSFYKPVQPPKVGDITLITMVSGHYLKDILSSSDRDAIGNGFAETYNPYKVEDSALHFHIPFLVNYTPALPNFGQKRFWNRVPRFPINGTPCSTLKQIYVFCTLKFGKQYLFKNHLRLWFEMCSMFVCFVGSKSWSFTTLLIGCWQKVTQNDGTDICSRHKGPQERTVNLDKRCRINVTFYPTVVRDAFIYVLAEFVR